MITKSLFRTLTIVTSKAGERGAKYPGPGVLKGARSAQRGPEILVNVCIVYHNDCFMFILNEILYAYTCTLSADRRETIFRLFFSAKTISQASGIYIASLSVMR